MEQPGRAALSFSLAIFNPLAKVASPLATKTDSSLNLILIFSDIIAMITLI
ncbi:hypothetical protein QS257_12670 [Terrilactibacillus sp. S3-3]|nr:hypothetical protein QS257_12670 [Terrilactibacillus sp. S3-3]